MARETKADLQKRIEQLEQQLLAAEKQIDRLQDTADNDFSASAHKVQLEKEVEKWKRLYLAQKSHNDALQKQMDEIKKAYHELEKQQPEQEKKHNARGAGRKLQPKLHTNYGYILDLINEEHMSYAEIAEICGVSKTTIYRKLKEARKNNLPEDAKFL